MDREFVAKHGLISNYNIEVKGLSAEATEFLTVINTGLITGSGYTKDSFTLNTTTNSLTGQLTSLISSASGNAYTQSVNYTNVASQNLSAYILNVSGNLETQIRSLSATDVKYSPDVGWHWYDSITPANLQQSTDVLATKQFFTNHTALRLSSTGLVTGGDMTIYSSSSFNISGGHGYIIDQTLSDSSGINPTLYMINWNDFSNISIVPFMSAGYSSTFVLIDTNGNYKLQTNEPTPADIRNYIFLGKVSHRFGQINNIRNYRRTPEEVYANLEDLNYAVGTLNLNGNIYAPSGSNLSIIKSSGSSYRFSANAQNDPKNPHITTDPLISPVNFRPSYRDSTGMKTQYLSSTINIDPNQWDDGSGTLQPVSNKYWTVQRIYFFPVTNSSYIFYGQNQYKSLAEVKAGFASENFILNDDSFIGSTFRGWLVVREGETNLQSSNTIFIPAGKYGAPSGGAAGGVNTIFPDDQFYIYNTTTTSNILKVNLNNLTSTSKTITLVAQDTSGDGTFINLPSKNGTLALISDVDTIAMAISGSLQEQINTLQAVASGGVGSINNILAPGGNIDIVGNDGTYITSNPGTKTITISISGQTPLSTTYQASANAYTQAVGYTNVVSGNLVQYINNSTASLAAIAAASANAYIQAVGYTNVVSGNLYSLIQSSQTTSGGTGTINCSSGVTIYSVTHNSVSVSGTIVLTTVVIPNANKPIMVNGVTNRTSTGFNIVLGSAPITGGYSINWMLTNSANGGSANTSNLLTQSNNLSDVQSPALARNNINQGIFTATVSGGFVSNCSTNNVFSYTLSGNGNLDVINLKAGATYSWIMKQDAIGGRTLTFSNKFKFPSSIVPVPTSAGNSVDLYSGLTDGSVIYMGAIFDNR